jgi:hypothetical protein
MSAADWWRANQGVAKKYLSTDPNAGSPFDDLIPEPTATPQKYLRAAPANPPP